MSRTWSQSENISKAIETQAGSRRHLSGFGMPASSETFGFSDCYEYRGENSPKDSAVENILSGLPKTTDHQNLKI